MELDKKYDLIVIGSNLSAYISAALAAKRGLETLLIDNAEAEDTFECSGFKFDFVPQYSAGFYPEKLFDKIFYELNLSIGEQFDIRKISATYQVITPKSRVNISDNFGVFKRELEREFPKISEKILNFYKTVQSYYDIMDSLLEKNFMIPPSTINEKKTYAKLLSSPGFSKLKAYKTLDEFLKALQLNNTEFEIFVKAQIYFFSYTYSPNPSFIQTVRILGNMMKRTCYIDGGYQKLIELLQKKLIHFGGEIKKNASIDEFIYHKKKLVGLRLSSFEGIIYSKYILSSLEINNFIDLLGRKIKRNYHIKAKTLIKRYSLYTINIGLSASVVPVGMRDRFVYVVNDKKPLVKENLILCTISHEKDEIKAPPGERVLCASCIVPYNFIKQNDPQLIQIKDRVLFNLAKIIPFLENHIKTVYPQESYRYAHLNKLTTATELPPIKHVFIYERIGKPYLGISAIPNRTQESNLFFTGREVLPDIGFEGEMHSCYKVINHVENEIKRKLRNTL